MVALCYTRKVIAELRWPAILPLPRGVYHSAAVIQGDQKASLRLMISIQNVTNNVQGVPRKSPDIIDTPNCVYEDRVQYNTVHIPNVFCDGHL
jgi:hypothetical protein